MYKRFKKTFFPIIATGIFFGIVALLYMSDLLRFFSLETLQCYARDLMTFTQHYYWSSVVFYLIIYIGAIMLFLPVVTILMIAGGFLFGPWEGALYGVIGSTVGACGAFMLVRTLVGPWVNKYEARLVTINTFIKAYGFYAVLLLRMSHLVPFFLLNIAAALMPISLLSFCIATLLGVVPGALLFSWTGQYLCSINSVWDLVSLKTIGLVACSVSGVLAMIAGMRWFFKRHGKL